MMKNKIRSAVGSGLGWGAGMGIALGLTSLAGGGMRPVAKGAVKGGLWAKDRLTIMVAEARERAEDIYFEARSEHEARETLLDGEVVVPAASNGSAAQPTATAQRS